MKKRIKSFIKYLISSSELISTIYYWYLRKRYYGRRWLKNQSLKNNAEALFLVKYNFNNHVVYDIGSSIGMMTQFFSASVNRKGKVFAFEPNPEPFEILDKRIGRDIGLNVKVFNIAIGKEDGQSEMIVSNEHSATGSIEKNIKLGLLKNGDIYKIKVLVQSLDNFIKTQDKINMPTFIKIDTEGLEYDVLKGSINYLKKYKPKLFIELHGLNMDDKLKNIKKISELLYKHNYLAYHIETKQYLNSKNYSSFFEGHLFC